MAERYERRGRERRWSLEVTQQGESRRNERREKGGQSGERGMQL